MNIDFLNLKENFFYKEIEKFLNVIYNIGGYFNKQFLLNLINGLTVLFNNIFVRNISLIECSIILDGFINAVTFLQEYIVYNISEKRVTSDINKLNYKRDIIKKCYNLYVLRTFDRYLLYLILYGCYLIFTITIYNTDMFLSYIIGYNINISYIFNKILYITFCCITFPGVQNLIMSSAKFEPYVDILIRKQDIFVKYSISKIIISSLQELDESVIKIQNYNIFKLYKHISFGYFYKLLKSCAFVHMMHILRGQKETYYYYKAIKLSYYYNNGYMFNVLNKDQSVFILNIIIKEKRWKDLVNIDVVNALYNLYKNKINFKKDKITLEIYLLQWFSIWSIIYLLKTFAFILNSILFFIVIILTSNIKLRNVFGLMYFLVMLNTNDLIITGIFMGYKQLYQIGEEIYFFVKNQRDIEKVINYLSNKKKTV